MTRNARIKSATPSITRMGTRGWLLQERGEITLSVQRRIWGLQEEFSLLAEVLEVVPGVGNILLIVATMLHDDESWISRLENTWQNGREKFIDGDIVSIPVTYGGEFRDDLVQVAHYSGLSPREVVEIHSHNTYDVFCIASSPGYGYLFGVDPRISIPRKGTPRIVVPAGAVCLAGNQTGVTVVNGPNGWHLLGRTEQSMFDINRERPALLKPGDRVKFEIRELLL